MEASGNTKGSLLVHLRAHVLERAGAAAWEAIVLAARPADRELLRGVLLTGSWYPVGIFNRALAAHAARLAPGVDVSADIHELGRRISEGDMSTLFKVILKLASPEAVIRRSSWLWTRYFDRGALTVTAEAPRDVRLSLDAPTGEDECAGQLVCAHGIAGWVTHALRLAGAPKASAHHTRCRFASARACEFHVRW